MVTIRVRNPSLRNHRSGDRDRSLTLARCNPRDYFQGEWVRSTPRTADHTSAAAWILGSQLQQQLNVPVGVIIISIGGSAMNNWIPPEVLKANPMTASLFEKDWLTNPEVNVHHRMLTVAAFQNVMGECKPHVKGTQVFNVGAPYIVGRMPYRGVREPGFLFEAGIAPLKSLTFRGVLWYQGESDANDEGAVERAATYFPMLVNSWRDYFGKEFPFLYIQLPGFKETTWPLFRELQRNMEKQLPNMSMVVTIDTGDEKDIHPTDKGPVAMRAVHTALRDVYGMNELPGFPEVARIRKNGGNLMVTFRGCGSGFKPVDGPIPGFEVADATGMYHGAEAHIASPDTVTVHSSVTTPVTMRYGWQPFPKPPLRLFNSAGLPAGPFRVGLDEVSERGSSVPPMEAR